MNTLNHASKGGVEDQSSDDLGMSSVVLPQGASHGIVELAQIKGLLQSWDSRRVLSPFQSQRPDFNRVVEQHALLITYVPPSCQSQRRWETKQAEGLRVVTVVAPSELTPDFEDLEPVKQPIFAHTGPPQYFDPGLCTAVYMQDGLIV